MGIIILTHTIDRLKVLLIWRYVLEYIQKWNKIIHLELNYRTNVFENKYQYSTVTPWWSHQMETFSALLAICAGNSPVPGEFPHKGQWRGDLMFSLICVWINGWVNNRKAGDLRRYCAHYDVIVMRLECNCIIVVHIPYMKVATWNSACKGTM